uniref:Uncharacterized protein n=1 Tax=Chromera velia CCMP2878 TaxID=1169474 RepID=A0A0G4HMA6_9ALVE|eukprot:Cvel_29196.t1-p1 / transcript=Cvel_29196.t1 / gene=Cvel_29196 / organism=Chromera_velia_CCMP2878 / gene_product=hypothetical protein / transcript_product=hypothetical protein / location=Cvel_scaffold3950:7534-8700(+) / protein_length=389 / sequence_SO=supercontig / SO=protein_coding / is_pseudo=false
MGVVGDRARSVFFTRTFRPASPGFDVEQRLPPLVFQQAELSDSRDERGASALQRLIVAVTNGVEIDDYAVSQTIKHPESTGGLLQGELYLNPMSKYYSEHWGRYTREEREKIASLTFPWEENAEPGEIPPVPSIIDEILDANAFVRPNGTRFPTKRHPEGLYVSSTEMADPDIEKFIQNVRAAARRTGEKKFMHATYATVFTSEESMEAEPARAVALEWHRKQGLPPFSRAALESPWCKYCQGFGGDGEGHGCGHCCIRRCRCPNCRGNINSPQCANCTLNYGVEACPNAARRFTWGELTFGSNHPSREQIEADPLPESGHMIVHVVGQTQSRFLRSNHEAFAAQFPSVVPPPPPGPPPTASVSSQGAAPFVPPPPPGPPPASSHSQHQ